MAGTANSVTLSTNFNVDPFYDDFDEGKNYHRILFRPGLAVQARELTQMQTILQNQIDRFAEHIFQEGTTVRGFEMNFDVMYNYVRLRDRNSSGNAVFPAEFNGATIKGATSGVTALVINTNEGSEANVAGSGTKTLFVKYQSANNSGTRYFANNEILTVVSGNSSQVLLSANTYLGTATYPAEGYGIAANFNAGIVYAKDHFIRVPAQTLILSKYDNTPTVRVGFDVAESIITEVDDATLLDPASGSYNYAAPGAARLKLEVKLKAQPLATAVSNTFVELMQVKNGVVQSLSNRTQYSAIRDYLAQRTSDESGDYVVHGMSVSVKEHLDTGTNGGVYSAADGGDTNKLVAVIAPGKAYVKGYDHQNIVSSRLDMDKGTDYAGADGSKSLVDYGNYILVDNVVGKWDIDGQARVNLKNDQSNAVSTLAYSTTWPPGGARGTTIGTARVRGIEYYTGTPGAPDATYKLYLTDVSMNSGYNFLQVKAVAYSANTPGKADVRYASANTQDSIYDRAVFRLPTVATKTLKSLRSGSRVANNDFTYYQTLTLTTDTAGSGVIYAGGVGDNQTFDGSGAISAAARRSDFHAVVVSAANTVAAGSVSITSGANTVTGAVGSSFTTKINKGDVLHIGLAGDLVVSAVNSDTSLNVLGTGAATVVSGKYYKKFISGQVVDLGGYGGNGARTVTISSSPARGATIDLKETFNTTGVPLAVVSKTNKKDGEAIPKTAIRNRLVQINVDIGGGTSYVANTTGPWPLGLSDGFKLVSVRKVTGGAPATFSSTTSGTDVTGHFELDTGMRDNYYDHARLVKKSTSSLTISSLDRLLVNLDHFTHSHASGPGFYSVDSYPVDDTNALTDTTKIYTYQIPVFVSPSTGLSYDLRDCIDIRPRISDTANSVSALTNVSKNPLTSTTVYNTSGCLRFSPPNEDFTTYAEYYLRRTDTVGVSKKGIIDVIRGVPGTRSSAPAVPEDLMALATVEIAPYPSLPSETARAINRPDLANNVRRVRNERYTMRDIGRIRDRIDRLEYYTSLNLLEKNAKDLLIPDASGADRFKNGILVDSFKGFGIANPHDNDLKFTVDTVKGEMRPITTLDNVELVWSTESTNVVRTNVTPAGVSRDQVIAIDLLKTEYVATINPSDIMDITGATISSGGITATIRRWTQQQVVAGSSRGAGIILYVENATGNFTAGGTISISNSTLSSAAVPIVSVKTTTPGDLVTVSYTHDILVNQPYATTTRNCVGTAYLWRGTLTITPDNDYWVDTVTNPVPVEINLDLNTDNFLWLANAMPTTWQAYQTIFTGKPVLTGTSEKSVGATYNTQNADGSQNVNQNYITENIYTTPTIQTRSGLAPKATVVETTQVIGNYMTNAAFNPWMRSRMIFCKLEGMKAGSRIYGFFDGIDVNTYITPLTENEHTTKLIAAGTLTTTKTPVNAASSAGTALYTNSDGTAYCVFTLPAEKFHTGTKRLRFVDNMTNSTVFGQFTTSAETDYSAMGLMAGTTDLTLSTRQAVISQQLLTENKNVDVSTPSEVAGSRVVGVIPAPPAAPAGCGASDDPIAQTMLISALLTNRVWTSGMYLTKVDLFFATKDASLPVVVELREVDAATSSITSRVVPFSRVVVPSADVNISSDSSAATSVYFPSPVYVGEGKEYAIVIIPAGANPNYNVFTSVLTEAKGNDLLTGSRVSEQPAAGFLFTSANQRTWVPVENEDLKFTAYFAKFDTVNTGSLIVKNENREFLTIANTTGNSFANAGNIIIGEVLLSGGFSNTATVTPATLNTAGSHYAHGLTSNAYGTITYFSTSGIRVKGIPSTRMFVKGETIKIRKTTPTTGTIIGSNTAGGFKSATYPIGRTTYYDATTASDIKLHIANSTFGNTGPANTKNRMFIANTYITNRLTGDTGYIVSIDNVAMDNINLITNLIQPSNTAISGYAKFATSTSAKDSTYNQVTINDITELSGVRYILSRSNEANTSASSASMGKSASIQYLLDCRNSVASPAIDLRRISIVSTHNLISSNSEIGSSEDWVKFGGNSKTRYITRRVSLADGQDAQDLRVYLAAYQPPGSKVYVYTKILSGSDNDLFTDARWIPMTLDESQGFTQATAYSSSVNKDDYIEFTYKIPDFPTTAITDSSGRAINQYGANTITGVVEYRNSAKAKFDSFKQFAIKIVLTNDSSTNPPRVHELRAIALQGR